MTLRHNATEAICPRDIH